VDERSAVSERDCTCDVLIVGGGLAGSMLARALAAIPMRTVLVEAREAGRLEQPSFDDRATALAEGSRRILCGLDLWEELREEAEPIKTIHVSEQGRFGAARISAADEGVPALGYTLENRVLGRRLWDDFPSTPQLTCLAPARVTALHAREDAWLAEIESNEERLTVRARLLVAADGARSWARGLLGIDVREDPYRQRAVILNCRTEAAHAGRAFERFTSSGPLAFLPLTRDRVSVVWTCRDHEADAVMALADDAFRDLLQDAFGYRLGRIVEVGRRSAHPLARVRSVMPGVHRAVLIGSAAVNLHPVAGQGFNLALRDVATLAETLADASREGERDAGAASVLERYHAWRAADQRRVAWFTHGLVRLFGQDLHGFGAARGLGLVGFDLAPAAKHTLARHSMGLAGRLPRLARGLPLRAGP
jgi:2-octaprenyl-6-methoxyphenol hydroxylase